MTERIFERNLLRTGGISDDLRRKHEENLAKMREGMLAGESPLAFLGQVSLRQIHAVAPLPGWPTEGMLAFFYAPEQIKGHRPQCRGHCRVLFFPEDVPLRQLDYPQLLGENGRYPERALTVRREWTLDKYVWTKSEHTPLWKDKNYLELLEKLNADGLEAQGPVHRCGGFAQEFQNHLRTQCQLVTSGIKWDSILSLLKHPRVSALDKASTDWQLVMQFDPERSLGWKWWASAGRVYFMARQQDIEAGDFSNCWAIMQRD